MKKLLLALSLIGTTLAANAASTSGILNVTGEVTSSCSIAFSTGVNFVLVPNATPAPGSATMTLACTAGTQISAMTATSANGWQLIDPIAPADTLAYTLTMPSVSPAAYDGVLIPNWTGGTGDSGPVDLLANGAFSITNDGEALVASLTVTPAAVPQTLNVGSYADTVTVAATF